MAAIPASKRTTVRQEPLKPFMNVVRSEWTKLITHRNSHMMLLLAAILSIGVAALFAWATGFSFGEWPASEQAALDPLQSSLLGVFFAGIISLIIAANLVTTEYSSGMIRQTFTVTPLRWQVVLGKIVVAIGYLVVPMMVLTFTSLWVAQVILGNYDVPTADIFGSDFRTVFWLGLSGLYYPVLTVSIAFLLRSSATIIAVVMMTMFFPAMFGGLFPRVVQERVLSLLPANAIDAVVMGHLSPDYAQYLDRPWAALVAAAWLFGLTGVAIWNVNRRDVG